MGEKKGIVKSKENFEFITYINNERPSNYILDEPDGTTWRNEYFLVNTGVSVSWQDYYNYKGYKVLKVKYKQVELLEQHNVHNAQIIIDTLNKFNNISKVDLEQLYQDSQIIEKSTIEISIEELKKEKAQLEEQIKIYKAIQIKKDEIKALIAKLE